VGSFCFFIILAGVLAVAGVVQLFHGRRGRGVALLVAATFFACGFFYILHDWDQTMRRIGEMHPTTTVSPPSGEPKAVKAPSTRPADMASTAPAAYR
jgi:hypothetical protein